MSLDDDQMMADYLERLSAAASALPADRRAELIEEITVHIAEARAAGGAPAGDSASMRNILERLGDPADIVRAAADVPFGVPPAGQPGSAYPGAGYPGSAYPGSGYPGAGYPGAGYPGPGYPDPAYPGSAYPGSGYPAGPPPLQPPGSGSRAGGSRVGALEICAVLFLLIGGLVIPLIGWVIGVVLLWISPRWRTSDKLLGTLVWPGGLLAPVAVILAGGVAGTTVYSECSSGGNAPSPVTQAELTGTHHFVPVASQHVTSAVSCTNSGGTTGWLAITLVVILLALAIAGPVYTAIRLLRRAGRVPAEPLGDPAAMQTV